MSTINIKAKDFSKKATKVEIEVNGFPLNSTTCVAIAIFKNDDGKEIKRDRLQIPPEVFSVWGTDDSVIENYVLAELGLEKQ